MHEYTAGSWFAVVGESAVALLAPSLGADDARRMWEEDRDGTRLSRWIELLAARGITTLPPFALVEAREEGLFVIVRGDLTVRAGSRTVTGRGYSTWYEELVSGATEFEITTADVGDGDATLPVSTGIVLASRIASRAPAGEENGGLSVADGERTDETGADGERVDETVADGERTDETGAEQSPDGDVAGTAGAGGSGAVASDAGAGGDDAGLGAAAGAGIVGAGVAGAALAGGEDVSDDDAAASDVRDPGDDVRADAAAEAAERGADVVADAELDADVVADAELEQDGGRDEAEVGAQEGAATIDGHDAFQDEQGQADEAPAAGLTGTDGEGAPLGDPYHQGAALEQSEDDDAHDAAPGRPDDAGIEEALAAEDALALTEEPSDDADEAGDGTAVDAEVVADDQGGFDDRSGSDDNTGPDDGLIENVPWAAAAAGTAGAAAVSPDDDASGTPTDGTAGQAGDDGDVVEDIPAFEDGHTQIYDAAADEQAPLGTDHTGHHEDGPGAEAYGDSAGVDQRGADQDGSEHGVDQGYGQDGGEHDGDQGYGRDAGEHPGDQGGGADAEGFGDQGYGDQGRADQGYGHDGGGHYGVDHDGHTEMAGPDHDGATSLAGIPVGDYDPDALVLVLSDGTTVVVDRPILLGRAPDAARFSGDDVPRLVQVRSPERDVSATHVEVRPAGESVVVTDMDSTNGTVIVLPDQPAFRLHPRTGVPVPAGAYVELGTDAGFHVDGAGQVPEQ